MKSLLQFIRTTFTGGVLFLLPIVLIYIFLHQAYIILEKVSTPISEKLPELIFGLDGSMIITLFLLIFLCFIGGLLFRSAGVKKLVGKLEEKVLIHFPGYALIKSITADAVGANLDQKMTPIAVQDGETYNIGFLVEEGAMLSVVFFPDAPRHDAGEMKIVPNHFIRKLPISANKFVKSINNFGSGIIDFLE
ncbi:MAG: hypothetical protein MUO53_17260 [Maribacter sp.]|nr:hypothetical protein [Maribacter sp.]